MVHRQEEEKAMGKKITICDTSTRVLRRGRTIIIIIIIIIVIVVVVLFIISIIIIKHF